MLRSVILPVCRFVEKPAVQLMVAIVLIVVSISELWQSIGQDLSGAGRLRLHHGMLLFGLINAMTALPPLVDGLERMSRSTSAPLGRDNPPT